MRARAIALTLCTVGTMGLASCSKPTPGVTVWTGDTSVQQDAVCWAPDSTVLSAISQCIQQAVSDPNIQVPTIPVTPGQVIGINVDGEIADAGWTPSVSQQSLAPSTLHQNYYRFDYPSIDTPAQGFLLTITAHGQDDSSSRGLWLFRLVPSGTL